MLNSAAAFNRRMRKTARPVVWEGAEAQSSAPDPIGGSAKHGFFLRRGEGCPSMPAVQAQWGLIN